MICNLCKGTQNLFNAQAGRREWFDCPFCKRKGDIHCREPDFISISQSQQKVLAKAETRKKQEEKRKFVNDSQSLLWLQRGTVHREDLSEQTSSEKLE